MVTAPSRVSLTYLWVQCCGSVVRVPPAVPVKYKSNVSLTDVLVLALLESMVSGHLVVYIIPCAHAHLGHPLISRRGKPFAAERPALDCRLVCKVSVLCTQLFISGLQAITKCEFLS